MHVKSALFSADNGQTARLSIFTVFLIIKTSSQNISITLLKISLKSHEHRGCYCWKKLVTVLSARCYDNCDAIETLIITSFHLYLIQLCSPRQFFLVIFIMSFKPLAINLQYTLLIERTFYLCKSH